MKNNATYRVYSDTPEQNSQPSSYQFMELISEMSHNLERERKKRKKLEKKVKKLLKKRKKKKI